MTPPRKDAFVALAVIAVVAVIGFALDGLEFSGYAAFSTGLICAVCMLWKETHRLRRAQATRTNRISKRLSDLEQQTSLLYDVHREDRDYLARRIDEANARTLEALIQESTRLSQDQLDTTLERISSITDHVTETVESTAANYEKSHKRISREENRVLYSKVDDLVGLYRDIDPDQSLPALHGWAVGPDFARFLYQEVVDNKRANVFECGSGSTTVILAYAMRTLGAGHVVSLEHDPNYASLTRHMLTDRGLSRWADVVYAPLVEVDIDGTNWRWYDPARIPEVTIDLLLVDGPPGPIGPHARYPAMPLLADRLSQDAVVMLDDAYRTDEQEIGRRWKIEFDEYQSKTVQNDYGTLVFRRGPRNSVA